MGSGRISDGVKAAAANAAIFLGSLTPPYEPVNGPLTETLHFHEPNLTGLCLQGRDCRLAGLATASGHTKKVLMTFSDAMRRVRRPLAVFAAAAVVIAAGTLVGLALPPSLESDFSPGARLLVPGVEREFRWRNQHQAWRNAANRERRRRPAAPRLYRFTEILIRLRRPAARQQDRYRLSRGG